MSASQNEPELITAIKDAVGGARINRLIEAMAEHARNSELKDKPCEQAEAMAADIFIALHHSGLLESQHFKDGGNKGDLSTAEALKAVLDDWLEEQVSEKLQSPPSSGVQL